VLEPSKSAGDVARHGNVNVARLVVPSESEAAVERAIPFGGDGVELAESDDEMIGMLFANVFDTKVVDD
jgi:hypothetical protein